MYLLTRDDGAFLQVTGGDWEAALELASLFGWEPAGTESPQTPKRPDGSVRTHLWDRMDYFSRESQRVGWCDARSLSESVLLALDQIQDCPPGGDAGAGSGRARSKHLPSRRSAVAEGMSAPRRKLLRRLAAFAELGGFRIDGVD